MRRWLSALLLLAFAAFTPARAAGDMAVTQISVTIASGASLSAATDLGPYRVFAIVMPASWTTANLTFQGSSDGINFFDLYDDTGTEVSVTATASKYIILTSPVKLLGLRWLKVRSGTTGTPVNQAADRIVKLVGVP